MTKFIIHWLTTNSEAIEGESISQAFTLAGYGAGAIKAVDWYEEIE